MSKKIVSYILITRLNKKTNELYKYQKWLISQLKNVSDFVYILYADTLLDITLIKGLAGISLKELALKYDKFNEDDEIILVRDSFFGLFCNIEDVLYTRRISSKKIFTIYNSKNTLFVYGRDFSINDILKYFKGNLNVNPQDIDTLITTGDKILSPIHDLYELVKNYRLPFIDIECAFIKRTDSINFTLCQDLNNTIKYLYETSKYDVGLIYEFLIDNLNLYDIKNLLNLNYIIDKDLPVCYTSNKRIALFVYLFYDDLIEECMQYINNIPKYIDIFISTDSIEKIIKIKSLIKGIKNNITFSKVNARGRDIAVFFTEYTKYFKEYDYACFLHDKKSIFMGYSVGKNFRNLLWDNVVISENYINQLLKIFNENKYIGLLVPPNVYHGGYFYSYCNYWGKNFNQTKQLLKIIDDKVPLDYDKEPISVGSVFWFKTKALLPITKLHLNNKDFPEEPYPFDGSIAHAIERLFPYVAQSAGYLTATIYNSEYAATELCSFRVLFKDYILSKQFFEDDQMFNYSEFKEKK